MYYVVKIIKVNIKYCIYNYNIIIFYFCFYKKIGVNWKFYVYIVKFVCLFIFKKIKFFWINYCWNF